MGNFGQNPHPCTTMGHHHPPTTSTTTTQGAGESSHPTAGPLLPLPPLPPHSCTVSRIPMLVWWWWTSRIRARPQHACPSNISWLWPALGQEGVVSCSVVPFCNQAIFHWHTHCSGGLLWHSGVASRCVESRDALLQWRLWNLLVGIGKATEFFVPVVARVVSSPNNMQNSRPFT